MVSPPLCRLLGAALVLTLASCTTVYQYATPPDPDRLYRTSAVRFVSDDPIADLFSPQPAGPPAPGDLVLVTHALAPQVFDSLDHFVGALFRNPVVVFEGRVQWEGQTTVLKVQVLVRDLSGKKHDPQTGQETNEEPFTRSILSQVQAWTPTGPVFSHPETLDEAISIPYRLFSSSDLSVWLTSLETITLSPKDRDNHRHGLWSNLKATAQVFEVRDPSGRVVAWFDNTRFTILDDDTLDGPAIRTFAAGVLAFQAIVRRYYLENTTTLYSGLPTVATQERTPIVFPAKP